MKAMQNILFSCPADNTRPFRSHRYDVYGVKIRRRLFVYGELALSGFAALEADPDIVAYCERPIVIEAIKPKRIVDFWVQRSHNAELWLLLRPSELKWLERQHPPTEAFYAWAEDHHLRICLYTPESLGMGSLRLRNWGEIVRHLSANLKYLDDSLAKRVAEHCRERKNLGAIQDAFPQDDPVMVRTAVFHLLHKGALTGVDLADTRLGINSVVEPA